MALKEGRANFQLPLIYSLFFLFLEPISALVGAYYSYFYQAHYLDLLYSSSSTSVPRPASHEGELPRETSVALSQLANMYLFFALNEAFVLRATSDIRTWRAVLLVLLIADLGHLFSLRALGVGVYYDVAGWNACGWGNVPWVYAGMTMRLCFLKGVGLGQWKTLTRTR